MCKDRSELAVICAHSPIIVLVAAAQNTTKVTRWICRDELEVAEVELAVANIDVFEAVFRRSSVEQGITEVMTERLFD